MLSLLMAFQCVFRNVFDHRAVGWSLGDRLLDLQQGNRTATDFTLEFHTIDAALDWPPSCLQVLYRCALILELQAELECWGEVQTFDEYVHLSI